MSPIKLGCQTITWGDQQDTRFPEVFAEVAAAGFSGVEIGFRRLQRTPPRELTRMLNAAGLTLLGTHIGGNLEDAGQADSERKLLDCILDYMAAAGTSRLMYSGLRYRDNSQFQRDLEMVCRSAARCRERSVMLLYHNHDWEFANQGPVMEALIEKTDIGFCPDVGWVMKGGADALSLLRRMAGRVGAIHFKDFASGAKNASGSLDTVLLGDGVAPLAEVAQWARNAVPDVWMIAEQDKTDRPTAEVAQRNGEYMRRIFSISAAPELRAPATERKH